MNVKFCSFWKRSCANQFWPCYVSYLFLPKAGEVTHGPVIGALDLVAVRFLIWNTLFAGFVVNQI